MRELTHDLLLKVLRYEPESGEFIWLRSSGKAKSGSKAGNVTLTGSKRRNRSPRCQIRVFGKSYYRSRLAWFYMKGQWPKLEIDHQDVNSLNDRWENLREATGNQNRSNTKARKDTRFGLKGVYLNGNRCSAQITVGGKRMYLGSFDTPEAAHEAYVNAAKDVRGEFFRAN
jgi:hypothetical protein